MSKPVILCVDDEPSVLHGIRQELERYFQDDYLIEIAESGEEGLGYLTEALAEGRIIPVILSDQLMPGMKGDELFMQVNRLAPQIKKILMTGQATAEQVGNALNQGNLYRYIPKPWDTQDLCLTVEEAIKSYYTQHELVTRIEALQLLTALAKELSQAKDYVYLCNRYLSALLRFTKVDEGFLYLFISQDFQLNMYGSADGEVEAISDIPAQPLTENLQPGWIKTNLANNPSSFIDAFRDQHALVLPITTLESIQGYLYLSFAKSNQRFSQIILEFIELLSVQFSASLQNAFAFYQLEVKVAERTFLLEEKNKHILDSIQYAKRIQKAILPPYDFIDQYFKDFFILYSPKDIVSGDFYWFAAMEQYLFIAAVDCTGHGVPGAFMSVVGNNLLNHIIKDNRMTDTSDILNTLHIKVKETMHQQLDEEAFAHEGMDIALCRFDTATQTLQFSGANRPLYHYRGQMCTEYKPNKLTIGRSNQLAPTIPTFSHLDIPVESGDRIFMFTDGITDQFGGTKGRKYSYARLLELLTNCHQVSMVRTHQLVEDSLDEWRGQYPQIDDMLLIGIHF
jgi:serine phosphatase RsbU (regulator of sigma subunit)/CheY-like chemotaxis protein